MKLLIAGSRSISQFDLTPYVSSEVEWIITGGASGIDRIAEAYADQLKISKLILRPQYHRYGKGAPLRRNREMVELADAVLVIWDGHSKGSLHTMEYAQKQGKTVTLVCLSSVGEN